MVKSYTYITKPLLKEQLEGKRSGAIRLLINVRRKKIYSVEPSKYHSGVAATLLGMGDIDDLKKDPQSASHLIPSVITIEDNKITVVVTGKSSLEVDFHIKHTEKDLENAHLLVLKFVDISYKLKTVSKAKEFEDAIIPQR